MTAWIEPPPPQRGMGCFAKGCLILCGFFGPQFSADGRRIYFMSAKWATSPATHALELATGKTTFLYAGGVEVLRTGKYKGFRCPSLAFVK